MSVAESVLRALAKYSKRMYGRQIRPRGNPNNLIKMLSPLLNSTKCFVCQKIDNVIDLHHINGDWTDYSIENLVFVCHSCHLHVLHQGSWKNKPVKLSREVIVQNFQDIQKIQTVEKTRRINGVKTTTACAPEGTWVTKAGHVSDNGLQLFNYIGKLVGEGYSIIEACRELSPYYGVGADALCTAYGIIRKRKTMISKIPGVSITQRVTKPVAGRIQMTFAEYYHYRRRAEQDGVDII